MQLGLTYSATCEIYWVTWDFPVLSPDRDIPGFDQENTKIKFLIIGARTVIRYIDCIVWGNSFIGF